ncbi:hypothetical protein JCM8097_001525 [Rhodosporidiobolus ruineniae]
MPSNCLATQLPPELLLKIFRLVRTSPEALSSCTDERKLAALALVCRGWRAPAQEELYRTLRLPFEWASGPRRRKRFHHPNVVELVRVVEVDCSIWKWGQEEPTSGLDLTKLAAVRVLRLFADDLSPLPFKAVVNSFSPLVDRLVALSVDKEDDKHFRAFLSRLSALTSYTETGLHYPFLGSYEHAPPPTFQLHALSLAGYGTTRYFSWLTEFSASFLCHLSLATFLDCPTPSYNLSSFSNLSHLTVVLDALEGRNSLRSTLSSASTLPNLRSLHIHQNLWLLHPPALSQTPRLGSFLSSLAPSIRTLELDNYLFRPKELVEVLSKPSWCPNLQHLVVGHLRLGAGQTAKQEKQVVQVKAEERGVEVCWWAEETTKRRKGRKGKAEV